VFVFRHSPVKRGELPRAKDNDKKLKQKGNKTEKNVGTYASEKKYVYFNNLPCTKSKTKIL